MTTLLKTILVLLLMVALMTLNAAAHTPRAREAIASVQTINYDKRTLWLTDLQGRGPREMIWHSDTMFLRDWKVVSATELKEGTHARVYYHSPFFGKPFITKVIWENGK